MTDSLAQPVIVGRIGSVFGVRGWLKIFSYTEPKENILSYRPWYLLINNQWQEIELTAGHPQGEGLVAQLKGCTDRDEARRYTGIEIGVYRHQFPELAEGEFYWSDLVGLKVVTTQGLELGMVDHLFATGANDVLVVKGDVLHMIPYLPGQVVKNIDLQQQMMQVDWELE